MVNFTHSHWNWQTNPEKIVVIVDNNFEIKSPNELCVREHIRDLDENTYKLVEDSAIWDNSGRRKQNLEGN